MATSARRRLPLLMLVVVLLFGVFAPVNNSYAAGIPNEKVAKEAFQKLLGMGATPQVSAAILGNGFQESGIDPKAMQGGKAKSFVNGGDLCKSSGLGGGAAVGIFQWDSERRDSMLCYTQKQKGDWHSLDLQLKYAFVVEMKKDDPFKISSYGSNAKGKYCSGSGADCSKVRTKMKGISEYFKGTDVGAATVEFVGYWERPRTPHSKTRVDMANKIYKKFKDLDPIDLGESVSDGDGKDGKKNEGGGSGGMTGEEDLEGMPETKDWDKGNPPKDATIDDLDIGDQYNVAALEEDIKLQQEGGVHTAQIMISLIGMLVMLWGILLFSGMLVDKSNPFLEFQCTRFLSAGRMEYVEDPQDKGKGRYMGRQIAVRSGVGVLLGLILVSGTFFGITLSVILFLQDKF